MWVTWITKWQFEYPQFSPFKFTFLLNNKLFAYTRKVSIVLIYFLMTNCLWYCEFVPQGVYLFAYYLRMWREKDTAKWSRHWKLQPRWWCTAVFRKTRKFVFSKRHARGNNRERKKERERGRVKKKRKNYKKKKNRRL